MRACGAEIKGTALASPAGSDSVRIREGDKTQTVKRGRNTKITRGQIGREMRDVPLRDIAEGDLVIAQIENGQTVSIKAYYGIVRGVLARTLSSSLILKDGRTVAFGPDCQFMLPNGKLGKAADIAPGNIIICRVNPTSGEAWTIVAAEAASSAQPASPTPSAAAPKITSVTFSAPSPLQPDNLITVDMAGTPGAKATFEIKGLIPRTAMREVSPGAYHAEARVPKGKSVRNAAVIGSLVIGDHRAPSMQAARLVSVGDEPRPHITSLPPLGVSKPAQLSATKPEYDTPAQPAERPDSEQIAAPAPKPAPAPAVHIEQRKPEPPAPARIVVTTPPDGSKIKRALLVRGTADPDSSVRITITYSNGLSGILKLAGEVASETVAVGKDGMFRMGPVPLEGSLATDGLQFMIKAYYINRTDHGSAVVRVIGARD